MTARFVNAYRLRACVSITIVAVAMLVLCASTIAGDTPKRQLRFLIETRDRVPVLGLFITERGEKSDYEFAWFVASLPCEVGLYFLLDTAADIASAGASSEEAQMRLLSVHLPRGVRCGTRLASQPGEKVTITVKSRSRRGEAVEPLLYSGGGARIESYTPCVSFDGLCTGRFTMIVDLASPRRHLTFVYPFNIFHVKSTGGSESPRKPPTTGLAKCLAR